MKIYSWNVNGIRAVERKEALAEFIETEKPDILLLQEIKGKEDVIEEALQDYPYKRFYNPAEKAGYSGVAIWVSNNLEDEVIEFKKGMPKWDDVEGRVAQIHFKNTVIISIYGPNGGKSEQAYEDKLRFFDLLKTYIYSLDKRVIVGGDFNVARSDIDLSEPDKHRNHTHFNEEIKGKMETLLGKDFVDTFRSRNEGKEGCFTYWDNFDFKLKGIKPRDVNKGWRIDYLVVDKKTNKEIKSADINNNVFGSDHCPISITLQNYSL